MGSVSNNLYEFGGFRFDSREHKLWAGEELILLSPKASGLLKLLLDNNGEFVSKEKILDSVWGGTFVEEGVLTQNIYTLRKALGKTPDGEPIIENKTRLGYRVTVPVVRPQLIVDKEPPAESPVIAVVAAKPKRRAWKWVAVAASVLIVAGLAGWIFARPYIAYFLPKPIESVKFTQLTNTGDITGTALSPEGDMLAFVRSSKLYLKDIAAGNEILLNVPNVADIGSMQFSADRKSIFFRDSKGWGTARIMRTSRFGGPAEVIAERTDGLFSISADDRFIAFYRADPPNERLIIKDLETREERTVFEPVFFGHFCINCVPAWSPDGKKLLHVNQWWGGQASQLFVVDAESGTGEEVKVAQLRRFGGAAWFPDGNSFVVAGSPDGRYFHLWKVDRGSGSSAALTNGISSYARPYVSKDGKKILTSQTVDNANLFLAGSESLDGQKQLTVGNTNRLGQLSLTWIDNDRIVYSAQDGSSPIENLWSIDHRDLSQRQLTRETQFPANTPSSDGRFVYYNINRNRAANISRAPVDGGEVGIVTDESKGNRRSPQVSPDGKYLYYVYFDEAGSKLARRDLETGAESMLVENAEVQCGLFLTLSPDGKYLACFNFRKRPTSPVAGYSSEAVIVSVDDPNQIYFVPVDTNRVHVRFSPDSGSIDFLRTLQDGAELVRQDFRDPANVTSLIRMPNDLIFNFAWSKDGKSLALSRGTQHRDAVLLTDF